MIVRLKYVFAFLALAIVFSCSNDSETDSDVELEDPTDVEEVETYLAQEYFNSTSLISFSTVSSRLEDGSTADCYQLVFSSNPVAHGPNCPETIDDVAGMSFYDGATNPGLRVWDEDLLNDIEADGYDMVDAEGNVNIDDFASGAVDMSVSYCLDAAPDDSLEITFLIPVTPKLAASNNNIGEIEIVGVSIDGVPINGAPPSAINGPAMFGANTSGQVSIPSLDPCGGHFDPAGYYHWHLIPEVANQVLENNNITSISCTIIEQTTTTTLSGFAKDGFPIYAYAVTPEDLDECGGRTAETEEFPNGVYHYVASTTVAPNVPVCLKGVAADNTYRVN